MQANMIDDLLKSGYLKTPRIIEAFKKVNRADFLPEAIKEAAEINQALPLMQGQTNSQPLVVAFMLEELQPKKDQRVLDIGSGSCWTTALLAEIVGSGGVVVGVEIIEELCHFGQDNLDRLGYKNTEIRCGDWEKEIKEDESFDRIQAACASPFLPAKLKKILKIGGRLVLPIEYNKWGDQSIRTIVKNGPDDFDEMDHPGFVFVPMINQ